MTSTFKISLEKASPMIRKEKSSVSYSHRGSGLTKPKITTTGSSRERDLQPPKPKTILQSARRSLITCPIIIDGKDVTPLCLNPYLYEGGKERQISILDNTTFTRETSGSLTRVESQKFQANLLAQKQEQTTTQQETTQTMHFRSTVFTSNFFDDLLVTTISSKSEFSRDFLLVDDEYDETGDEFTRQLPIPQHISLVLRETETEFLLDFGSSCVGKGTPEGDFAEDDNLMYEFLTSTKGRNRKVIEVGVQTLPILQKTRDTEAVRVRFRHHSSFVSVWEMYDTYANAEKAEEEMSDTDADMYGGQNIADAHRLNDDMSIDSLRVTSEDKQMAKLIRNKRFLDAVMVIERLLSRLSDPDPLRENVEFKYRLELLWTFANDDTEGKCVTTVSFNDANEDILAVGYGKYIFTEVSTGIVMVWNIKNPQQPERSYKFPDPVTSLAFSRKNPNILAVGFYTGIIKVLDVSKKDVYALRNDTTSSCEPVWDILWFQQDTEEIFMASYGDGRIFRYQISDSPQLKSIQIMITARSEGKLKGIEGIKPCKSKEIAIARYSSARCLAIHPVDPSTYFVGTSEGVIHKCSTNYYNQHMDLFRAHDGPTHRIRFSPFANKLYITCGDDFRANIWLEGIHEPLISCRPNLQPVLDVDWSTLHSTILVSARGKDVFIWDMQRKMYEAQTRTPSPTNSKNTIIKFTRTGRCVVVGDMDGNVHVYALEDMPIPPFFPEDLLLNSLKRLVITKPELVKKIDKSGSLNYSRKDFAKYFN